jgi:hypothetical protein
VVGVVRNNKDYCVGISAKDCTGGGLNHGREIAVGDRVAPTATDTQEAAE